MLIVLDTNVLVSSLLKRESNPAKVLDSILDGRIQLAVDQRIFQEYTDVLHRPKLNINVTQAQAILRWIAFSAVWVQSYRVEFQQSLIYDPGDVPFAEVAVCGEVKALITGNKRHFACLLDKGIKVLSPSEAVGWIESGEEA